MIAKTLCELLSEKKYKHVLDGMRGGEDAVSLFKGNEIMHCILDKVVGDC